MKPHSASYDGVQELLAGRFGFDVEAVGKTAIERAVTQRLAARGVEDVQSYEAVVRLDEDELLTLVGQLTVPETWFFRDGAPFEYLRQYATEEWMVGYKDRLLRVLSAPCSTGEEPYSIAITLLDAGVAPSGFHVDAVDVNPTSLAIAQRGVYGENSFRGAAGSWRERYFRHAAGNYRLRGDIKSLVHFSRGNLLGSVYVPACRSYDVIFCRNLFIYLTDAAQQALVASMCRWLAPGGVLFVGHAETACLRNTDLVPVKFAGSFAFRRIPLESLAPVSDRKVVSYRPRKRDAVVGADPSGTPSPGSATDPRRRRTRKMGLYDVVLAEIERMANMGLLAEAARQCERFVEKHPGVAHGYFLLGVIREAQNAHDDAAQAYRQALDRDPVHYRALVHLAAHLELHGQLEEARRLRERAVCANDPSGCNEEAP